MNSSTYIFLLVVFSASVLSSLGADMSSTTEIPNADSTQSTETPENADISNGSQNTADTEDTDTSTTSDATTEEATQSTGSTDTDTTEKGSCIEVTLPDALGIGKCLGQNLDLCQNENTLVPGLVSLVNCTVTSIFRNLTPQNFLVTVKDILVALISKLVPGVVRLVEMSLARIKSTGNVTIASGTCEGEIKIGVPNSLGKCLDKTLKLCEKGKPVDMSVIESLAKAVGCIVKDLFTTAPQETLKNLLCDLVKLVGELLGNPAKTAIAAFCRLPIG